LISPLAAGPAHARGLLLVDDLSLGRGGDGGGDALQLVEQVEERRAHDGGLGVSTVGVQRARQLDRLVLQDVQAARREDPTVVVGILRGHQFVPDGM
jgi:hypothetical protein